MRVLLRSVADGAESENAKGSCSVRSAVPPPLGEQTGAQPAGRTAGHFLL